MAPEPTTAVALHPVLARQLRRHLRTEDSSRALAGLIDAVSEAYHDADDERRLMASTIAATSAELIDRHERLERSEHNYRALFESNPWPLWVCHPVTLQIIAVNETAVERYGYDRDTMLAIRLDDLGPAEHADTLRACTRPAADDDTGPRGARWTLRTRHQLHSGRIVDVDLTTQAIEYGGRPACLAVAVDVTEQVEADRALRVSETRLQSIFDYAALGICELDLDGTMLATNPAFQELLGFTAAELRNRPMTSLSPVDEGAVTIGPLRDLIARRSGAFTVEQRFTRKDGQPIWGSLTVSMMDLGGGATCLLALLQNVSERKALEAQLTRQAFHDPLTGLANRALFRDRIAHALARATRGGNDVAVLFIDLDRFKTVNDGLGHAAGDRLLAAIGGRLSQSMRTADTVARLGGDEFAALLEGVTEAEALAVGERALAAFRTPVRLGASEVFVGASIGVAFGGDAQSADDLLRNGDVAMYAAKAAGGSRCALFEPRMHEWVVERQRLEADLRPALDRGEFHLVYQPILELSTNRVRGVEALLRWDHPERGMILPARFITTAEETGLIVPIGRWVLEQACAQTMAWYGDLWELDGDGQTDFTVSVNLSGRQLRSDDLITDVRGALARTGLPPRMLLLEITESVLVQELEGAIGRLEELRALGVRLAIDDFGTGYSSLSYLKRFPVAVLKIDKAFIDGIGTGTHDAAIVRTIVALAGTLTLLAVAEGIENGEQQAALVQAGCELGQGYHFARPMVPEELVRAVTLLRAEGATVLLGAGSGVEEHWHSR